MLDHVRFLHQVYQELKQGQQKRQMLESLILSEARFNNDLLQVALRTGVDSLSREQSALFLELETTSAELITTLGLAPHTVFDDRRDPTEQELLKLDQRGVSLKSLSRRPQTELWEYSMRKIRLLKALAASGTLHTARIALASRCRNLEFATRTLARRMHG